MSASPLFTSLIRHLNLLNGYNSVAEIGIGIICACLPVFNVLFRDTANYVSRNSQSNSNMKLSRWRSGKRVVRNVDGTDGGPVLTQLSYVEVGSSQEVSSSREQEEEGKTRESLIEVRPLVEPAESFKVPYTASTHIQELQEGIEHSPISPRASKIGIGV